MAQGTSKKTGQKPPKAATGSPVATLALVSERPVEPAKGDADAVKSGNGALKKKDLLERVTAATGGKKKDVKEVVEATIAVLGAALQSGEGLNLPPFGKARVAKSKGEGASRAMTVKLRGAGAKRVEKDRKQPLADPGEDG